MYVKTLVEGRMGSNSCRLHVSMTWIFLVQTTSMKPIFTKVGRTISRCMPTTNVLQNLWNVILQPLFVLDNL